MSGPRHIAVIDIGKTNAKVALVDAATLTEVSVRKMANRPLEDPPYRHHDIEAIWAFILDSLAELGREHPVGAISVTTHGATAALLDAQGELALPVLDYEDTGPETLRQEYRSVRPDFAETGSPPLPMGLNLGAQLFWQNKVFAEAFAGATSILTYPQYWSFRLTGVRASEVTSLGCHTDLWNPRRGDFTSLVDKMGWRELFPPSQPAAARLGTLKPELAARTGLSASTPVHSGIHDSNASLLPHVLARRAPFSVVSTGTWVVSMAIGGKETELDPARDTLINVNALGQPVCSARFMGGREHDLLFPDGKPAASDEAVARVLAGQVMLLPSVQMGSGPFPASQSRWLGSAAPEAAERSVAADFYLALMTASCLDLIGAAGPIVVEGPFAANALYCRMLRAATGREVIAQQGQATGTSIGAALLAGGHASVHDSVGPSGAAAGEWSAYAKAWRLAAGG